MPLVDSIFVAEAQYEVELPRLRRGRYLVDEARSEKRTNARKTTKSTRNVQPVNHTITMFSAFFENSFAKYSDCTTNLNAMNLRHKLFRLSQR